jgi:Tfp pilus assembly protein PilE
MMILGVLATIALSNFSSWVPRSHASEAVANLKVLADTIDACITEYNNIQTCLINNANMISTPTANFTYHTASGPIAYGLYAVLDGGSSSGPTFTCTATDNINLNGDTIVLCSTSVGVRNLMGSGIFEGMYSVTAI